MTEEVALHSDRARVGLVLSGGGAQAAYQAGVVKALSDLDVQVHAVSGASAGALNGVVITEAGGDLRKAARDLESMWVDFIDKSPIEIRTEKIVLSFAPMIATLSSVSNPLAKIALTMALYKAGLLDVPLADAKTLEKMLDRQLRLIQRGEGLPLYVSLFESEDPLTDLWHLVGGWLLDLWDTPPSEFRHIQSLPPDERKTTVLASAALPVILQARRLGPDGRRYVDGGMGGYRTKQGMTPAAPLVEDAGCTHLIVTHSSDGSPWRRDWFPDTVVLEVRPDRTMSRTGSDILDMFNFSEDAIRSLIDQGYEDAFRCVGEVKRSLNLIHKGREARARRDRAVDALDNVRFDLD